MGDKTLKRKIFLLLSVIVPSVVVTVLLGLSSQACITGKFALWTIRNRATTQAFVQVIATLMGACQIYTLSSLLHFWLSTRLTNTPASLDMLKLLDAVTSARLDLDVSAWSIIILGTYLVSVQIPSALWAGALTPIATNQTISAPFTIPDYSNSTSNIWTYQCWPGVGCPAFVVGNSTSLGVFSYQPWKDKAGLLLNAVSLASSKDSSEPLLPKLDNSGYTYLGRSYGMASTVGLVQDPTYEDQVDNLLSYRYEEMGYHSSVQCIYNDTADLELIPMGTFDDLPAGAWSPIGYWPNGSIPTGDWTTSYPTWGMAFDGTVFAIAAVRNSTTYMYGLVGGAWNSRFNGMQCEVNFIPQVFSVEVITRNKSVVVVPANATDEKIGYISWNESITDYAFFEPMFIAQTLNTMYMGVLVQAFGQDIQSVQQRNGHANATDDDYLVGTAEGFEVLLDYFLASTAAAQVMTLNDSRTVMAVVELQAMQLGEGRFIWAVFGICIIISISAVVDAARTRFWTRLPLFNPLDLKSVILGLASGMSSQNTELNKELEKWDGDASDRKVGALKVSSSIDRPVLTFTNTSNSERFLMTGNDTLPLLSRAYTGR